MIFNYFWIKPWDNIYWDSLYPEKDNLMKT